jgi:hypothetical protein
MHPADRDIGRIEREYLDVLKLELKFTEDDILRPITAYTQKVSFVRRVMAHTPKSPQMALSTTSCS